MGDGSRTLGSGALRYETRLKPKKIIYTPEMLRNVRKQKSPETRGFHVTA